jgi:DNA-binding MarR family transcriptional regulator
MTTATRGTPNRTSAGSPARWLSAAEQRHWRAFISAVELLPDRLQRELVAEHGITMPDYEILVRLSEADAHRLRMSELAERSLSSRSRLSHQVARMESAGLVRREDCAEDRRGQWAVMTDRGWAAIQAAAPDHVESVRTHLLDQLTAEEFAALGRACAKVVDHLQQIDAGA